MTTSMDSMPVAMAPMVDARAPPTSPPRSSSASATPLTHSTTLSPQRHHLASRQVFFSKPSDSPTSHQSERFRHSYTHARRVTRDIAALDFLQNIPMRSELVATATAPAMTPTSAQRGLHHDEDTTAHGHPDHMYEDTDDYYDSTSATAAAAAAGGTPSELGYTSGEPLAGRRLPGFEARVVRVPPQFRYRFATRYPAASAIVRRWEATTTAQGLLEARIFFSRGCGYPLATSTILKYNGGNEPSSVVAGASSASLLPARKRLQSTTMGVGGTHEPALHSSYDWRGKSYFLHTSWAKCDRDRDAQDDHPTIPEYVPNYLDDPAFRQGRHRHVVRGDKNIGPVISSILLFVKPHELKEELNKKFREKHTWLDTELSLSKIRNLKRETLTTCQRLNLEVATAALACVYFEKLVLSQYVNKSNRKLYMSACLILAAKFNEPRASDAMQPVVRAILNEVDAVHSIPSREVLEMEFPVYAQLSFSLHVPIAEMQPHFTRLLTMIESNPRKYLDDDVFAVYSTLVMDELNLAAVAEAAAAAAAAQDSDDPTRDDDEDDDRTGEAMMLMSDDDEGRSSQDEQTENGRGSESSALLWPSVAFSQWWRERRTPTPPPTATPSTATPAPISEAANSESVVPLASPPSTPTAIATEATQLSVPTEDEGPLPTATTADETVPVSVSSPPPPPPTSPVSP